MKEVRKEEQQGLYRREFEHDNCGIGAVVNIKGKKTHETVANALRIVEHLEHRAGSFCRFPINFLKKYAKKRDLILAEKGNMELPSCFFRSMRSAVHRRKKCLRLFLKRKI